MAGKGRQLFSLRVDEQLHLAFDIKLSASLDHIEQGLSDSYMPECQAAVEIMCFLSSFLRYY